jgi:hypothetical protein
MVAILSARRRNLYQIILSSFVALLFLHSALYVWDLINKFSYADAFDSAFWALLAAMPMELYVLWKIWRFHKLGWGFALIFALDGIVMAHHSLSVEAFPPRFILAGQLMITPLVILVGKLSAQQFGANWREWRNLFGAFLCGWAIIILHWHFFPVLQEWEGMPTIWEKIIWESHLAWPQEQRLVLFALALVAANWVSQLKIWKTASAETH